MGWQFAASELVGGIVMIVLLAGLGSLWLRGKVVVEARRRVEAAADPGLHAHEIHDPGSHDPGLSARAGLEQAPWRTRLRSKGAWADAASYTMADLTMLRRELVVGFTVAGFLAVVVPDGVWNALFIHGHGFVTTLENAVVGPFIALVSFVCSIGNVPLAAALWKGGSPSAEWSRFYLRTSSASRCSWSTAATTGPASCCACW